MKKNILLVCITFLSSNLFATAFCSLEVRVNNNFYIAVDYQSIYRDEIIAGIYFDILAWSANIENELVDTNGFIRIFLHRGNNSHISISRNGIEEAYYIDQFEDLTGFVISKLNERFETNGEYNNRNFIDLFVRNDTHNIAIDEDSGMIFSDYLYINGKTMIDNIIDENLYIIQTIMVTRENIGDIILFASFLCG